MQVRNSDGFSLLEVMIALTILGIGLSTIYFNQISISSRLVRAKEYSEATQLLEQKFEELYLKDKSTDFPDLKKTEEGKFEDPFGKYRWDKEIKEIEFPDLTKLYSGAMGTDAEKKEPDAGEKLIMGALVKSLKESLREMTVTITWGKNKLSQTIYLVTYKQDLALSP